MKKLYWIETVSTHRMCYAVEAETKPDLADLEKRINEGTVDEISQEWRGEKIDLIKEITIEDYITLFDGNVDDPDSWTAIDKYRQITNLDEEVRLEENG